MKNTTRESTLSFIRTLLVAIGAFFIGKQFMGFSVDVNWIEASVGTITVIIGGVWSWVSKELNIEKKISLIKTILTFAGGILVAAGKISDEMLERVFGFISVLLPYILSNLVKGKITE